jgi:hypothetical protein
MSSANRRYATSSRKLLHMLRCPAPFGRKPFSGARVLEDDVRAPLRQRVDDRERQAHPFPLLMPPTLGNLPGLANTSP